MSDRFKCHHLRLTHAGRAAFDKYTPPQRFWPPLPAWPVGTLKWEPPPPIAIEFIVGRDARGTESVVRNRKPRRTIMGKPSILTGARRSYARRQPTGCVSCPLRRTNPGA